MKLRLVAIVLAANLVPVTAAIALDANLPAYQAVSGISVEQRNGAMSQGVRGSVSQRKSRDRGQRLGYGPAGAPQRRFAIWSDVTSDVGR
jgi:hypothetical protein